MHAIDPYTTSGDWVWDMNCKWSGNSRSADYTCTVAADGEAWGTHQGTSTTTEKASDIATADDIFVKATVVTSSGKPTGSPSGSPAPETSGFAAAGPLPTGAVAFVGGAAGLFAAAMAL